MWCAGSQGFLTRAPTGIRSHGSTKKGEIMYAALRTPYLIGSVMHRAIRSPSISEKSFVVAAPSRNRPKIDPMYHGSKWKTDATIDQPATLSRQPRGIAIVTFAPMGCALVRPQAGAE